MDTARNRKDAQEPHNEKHGINHSLFTCVKQPENDAHTHQWQPERTDDCAVEKDEVSPLLQDVHGGDQRGSLGRMLRHTQNLHHLFQQDDSGHNSGAQQDFFFTWGFPTAHPEDKQSHCNGMENR